jgi:K+-sensing histidine kinase KdpD
MGLQGQGSLLRILLAALIPVAALVVQSVFWAAIQPDVWILFCPAVFFGSWIGGLAGGLVATALARALVWWYFIPEVRPVAAEGPKILVSVAVLMGMGVLFSISHGRLLRMYWLDLNEPPPTP